MDATYTDSQVELTSAVLRASLAELTIGQRMELGKIDYPVISGEILNFFAKPRTVRDFQSEATLLAGTSEQFKSLHKFGLITIEIG